MNPPDGIQEKAVQRVREAFKRRLRRGGIVTSRPEWFFECEAGAPQAYADGWQVRVKTWRHWSDARVAFDSDTAEITYRCVDRLSDPPTDATMSEADALQAAQLVIPVPNDAELVSFRHEPFAEGRTVARLEWMHFHHGIRVDGDYLWIMVHPETRRVVAFGRKWRGVRLD